MCLPISPRGHVVIFIVIVSILIHKSFKEVKKNYFPVLNYILLGSQVANSGKKATKKTKIIRIIQ